MGLYEFYDGFESMRWVTSEDVPRAGELRVPAGAIWTPSARELAEARAIRVIELRDGQAPPAAPGKLVALGADHGGFRLKEILKPLLAAMGLEARDVGVFDEKPADYPDIAQKVAELVASGEARRGVIIDGAGIGSSIAANKVSGIRAALCYDRASARNSREHNDSNVLTLGARLLTASQAEEVLRTWLETDFAGGRHAARVAKITRIEEQYGKERAPAPAAAGPATKQTEGPIASLIDHTMLRPEATRTDILKLCHEARQYGFATVCVNPYWVPLAAGELAGTAVKVCTVAGFPLGATSTEAKVAEAAAALRAGAREIDMVINVGALRSGDCDTVKLDIQAVTRVCHDAGAIVKVILETALLDDAQKITACKLAQAAGADFVKTSTGFGPAGATVQDVVLMRHAVGPRMGVKAAGGIRTLDDFRAMVAAGANRVGASASVKIVEAAGK
ncbi:MAG TPA: deoxyribose-phosphate aldolase [Bryobacteraceae bacterium]|nr:deoxyribose-phosphate aldolase [Bryobacteraceae bacterium]